MLQFSHYLDLKIIDFILILFSLALLLLFIQIIKKEIKNRNIDEIESENTDKENPDLPTKNPLLLNPKQKSLLDIIIYKGIPCLFGFVLLLQTINLLFPSILNSFFPSDSEQTIAITNNKKISQDLILLGRMSYSNDWITIMPFNNNLQFASIRSFKPSEKIVYNIRTGTKDIDNIIIVNVTKNKINKGTDALSIAVPCNDIAVFTEPMSKLNTKPNIYIFSNINYFLLYFTAIIGSVAVFLILFFRINKKALLEIIPLSFLSLLLVSFLVYAAWLNLKTILCLL